jgi:teichuronic acid biosynthesis glycosyltransferase TuaG
MTTVSIIVPAFNAEKYIEATILSIQNQTYQNWEALVVDDGSTDGTAGIVKNKMQQDVRIRYMYQPNGKQGKARNTAIAVATGKYLAFLDADDCWHPNKLEMQVKAMEDGLSVIVFCSGWWLKDPAQPEAYPMNTPQGRQEPDEFYRKQLQGYSIPMLSAIVKKEAVLAVGGFDEDLRVQNAEDYQLWLRLSDAGYSFYGLPDRLFYYRVHQGQSTHDDGMAILPSLWAMWRSDVKRISTEEKNNIILSRLNRYLIHNLADLSLKKTLALIHFYAMPLNRWRTACVAFLMHLLGKQTLLRWGYRCLDLTLKP